MSACFEAKGRTSNIPIENAIRNKHTKDTTANIVYDLGFKPIGSSVCDLFSIVVMCPPKGDA
jgi:hypothetical protein